MPSQESPAFFDKSNASEYDKRFIKLAPLKDALHLLISSLFAELPANARILCVGAGTGAEIIDMAGRFPHWTFTAVEPAGPMLDICRQRTEALDIASRCTFHEGYLDSLPSMEPFDAATSLLVSHFIVDRAARAAYFRGIAERLRPGAILASADLATDLNTAEGRSLLEAWFRLMKTTDISDEQIAGMRLAYEQHVAVLPLSEVAGLIAAGGFEMPVPFLQTGLIHAWYARRG